ncbi:uncharacterized protein KZ484_023754 isoform 2-T2 [Pholidichthys leucotaenia]
MVSVRSSELGPLGWDPVTNHRLFLQKVPSSRPGPRARLQTRGPPGPPGRGSPGPRQAQREGSSLWEGGGGGSAGGGSPGRGNQNQNPGVSKSRINSAPLPLPTAPASKPSANQQLASGSGGRPAAVAVSASRLPVKGLPSSLSSSHSVGNGGGGENNRDPPLPPGGKPNDGPGQSALPVGSQGSVKPPATSNSIPSAPSEAVTAVNGGKPPVRSRGQSVQPRATTTVLKSPTFTNHSAARSAAASQTSVKQSGQFPLQRSGSVRASRLGGSVDKNKPKTSSGNGNHGPTTTAASSGGKRQAPDLVPDEANPNPPVAAAPPANTTSTAPGPTGPSGLGFRARAGPRSGLKTGPRPQNAPRVAGSNAAAADVTAAAKLNQNRDQVEKRNQVVVQLRRLLFQGNRRMEALAMVIQHVFTEREEVLKQKKELTQELTSLRQELVTSSLSCERLQKEKEETRLLCEEALKRLQEMHLEEQERLEDRLRSFYQSEWDKAQQTYQEEAEKYRRLMERQVEELRHQQEVERRKQEVDHSRQMELLRRHHEASLHELKRIQQSDLENLQTSLKETETSLSDKISELTAEKEELTEKLGAEAERRKRILSDKNLKDSHTVYLEQELESLKVVLELKNEQLHQKEKKLMEMDKLVELNVKLEENLKKVQQENEDFKARMDKHAALSKQLSTEQALLQQSLQKESKVNKRLSMENEELLWKLHHGDLLDRRLSPTSPYGSPRNSASFTTAPLSPR